MSRISELIDEIKIYNICDHCDHYDTTKRCRIGDEGCNCKEEVERQIVAEIRADAIEPINAIIEESERMMWCADKTLEKIKEQLKEQK